MRRKDRENRYPMKRVTLWLIGVSVVCAVMSASADTLYVWTNSPAPGAPYNTWSNAAHTIQDAIDAASDADTVLVTNGVYSSGGRVTPGYALTNRIVATNAIMIQSVNGPEVTVIAGAGPSGNSAVRCAFLTNSALLCGFTLTNGHTRSSGHWYMEQSGGGACAEGASLSNCVISGNSADYGSGSSYGTLNNCTLSGNFAGYHGGGSYRSTLNNCTLSGNSADWDGGGSYHGTLNNCMFSGNSTDKSGGGSYGGTLNNCTLSGNSAAYDGGGCSYSTLNNCIIYYNSATNSGDNWDNSTLSCCCTIPDPGGTGNITNVPGFVAANDYHLMYGSPCIDSGTNLVTITNDLDGTTRPLDGDFDGTNDHDIGCYEYDGAVTDSDGDGLTDSNEIYGTGTSPTNINTDGDYFSDYEEMIADTDGTDSNSYFCLTGVVYTNSCTVTFVCTNRRVYSLEFTTNLTPGNLWAPVPGFTNVLGDVSGTMSLTDTVDDAVRRGYYRVGVSLP